MKNHEMYTAAAVQFICFASRALHISEEVSFCFQFFLHLNSLSTISSTTYLLRTQDKPENHLMVRLPPGYRYFILIIFIIIIIIIINIIIIITVITSRTGKTML